MCITLPCGYSCSTLTKVIAYSEITIYIIGIVFCTLFGVLLENRPDLLKDEADEKPYENQDILMLLKLPRAIQTGFILWLVMNFVAGLIFSVVLLRGAQERNMTKVKIWFMITIVGYIIWLPIFIFWVLHSVEPVNIVFSTLMNYIFGGLCLSVVYSFLEELRIESISHRPGFKPIAVAFSKI